MGFDAAIELTLVLFSQMAIGITQQGNSSGVNIF